jgi:polyisoprenoid-binding protein YceI
MNILLLLLISFSTQLFGKEWVINNDHSEVSFEISYMGISEVRGLFSEFYGGLDIDDKGLSNLVVNIKSSSLFTGNKMRDGHLRGNDFLKTKEHPLISFQGQSIQMSLPGVFTATGALTLKNKTRPLRVQFTLTEPKKDTWGLQSRFVKFKTSINRKDFNIIWNKTLDKKELLLGDEIKISGTLQLQPSGGKTPSTKHMIPDTPYIRLRERMGRGEVVIPPSPTTPLMKNPKIEISSPLVQKPLPQKRAPLPMEPKSLTWWVSFMTLGLFGFFGVISTGIYAKKFMIKSFPTYAENSLVSQLSDIPLIVLVFVYSVVLWNIGWN